MVRTIGSMGLFAFLILGFALSVCAADRADLPELYVFYTPSCHKCIEVKERIIPRIEDDSAGKVKIGYYDASDIANYKLLLSLRQEYNPELKIVFPVFFMNGNFFKGNIFKLGDYKRFITESVSGKMKESGRLPQVNLVERFKGFCPLTVAAAGLIDGINPCAFTVIVFFMSFLALQGYKKRELTVIGLTFIFSVFLTYVLIGLGLFGFLYRMENFPLITKIFNLSIGIFSIILSVFAGYDFFEYRKTGNANGLALQLPESVKKRIHSLIGRHYRNAEVAPGPEAKTRIVGLLLSALVTGFLVSILEAVCTGQVYLPVIAFVLKTTTLKISALGYLLLYNFMFIAPLLAVFFLSLSGISGWQFAAGFKRHLSTVKALMAVVFFGLGIFLVWRR